MKLDITNISKITSEIEDIKKKFNLSDSKLLPFKKELKIYLHSYNLCENDKVNEVICNQIIKGHRYKPYWVRNKLKLYLTPCKHSLSKKHSHKLRDNYWLCFFPNDMRKLKFEKELIKNSERNKTLKKITEILNNNHTSGLYIFGKSQTGKTYFFILLVNLLVEKNYTVVFLDLTRFLTQLKSEMSENVKTQKLVYKTINCDILFIDDLGNELITPWSRDEILFNILNYRIDFNKKTFINSNYDLNTAIKRYIINQKSDYLKIEKITQKIETHFKIIEWKTLISL